MFMAVNLVDQVSRALTPDVIQGISRFLGEDASAVQSGLGALIPTLLGGLASKAATPGGASSVFSAINGANVDTSLLGNLGSLLGSGQSNTVLQAGSSLLGGLFGPDKTAGIANALSGISGMKSGSATNLLLMAVPMLFSTLKRFIGENGLNAGGLASLLTGQKDAIANKLDPRLTSAFGLGSPASLLSGLGSSVAGAARGAATAVGSAGSAAAAGAATAASTSRRWLPWIVALVVIVLLAMMLPRCGTVTKEAAPVATAPAPAMTPAPAAAVTLPAKVYFETGKSDLTADGDAVVKGVAAILAGDASAKVDLTGYTDKTGDSAANQDLAKKRAESVKAALATAGVAAERVNMKEPIFVEVGAGGPDAEARRVEITAAK
jgi:outer membrane protein OmpA-like peptidoglycan-associated protein